MTNATVSFRPFLELTGVYDTGLAGVAVNGQGDLGNTSAFGIQVAGGISGSHNWRHTQLGLDYRGDLNHYNKKTFYDGSDQSLLLSLKHQFSRHIYFDFRESAGIFSRTYGLLGLPESIAYDPSQSAIPTTDFFDNRTMYMNTQADLILQKTARLSFDFGGAGFITRYRSAALYGVTGASAHGDIQYRASRRTTIGASYSYQEYSFTHIFSGTDLHSVTATYARQLSRHVELTGFAGVIRVETKFVQNVPVDPAIAALIGITESQQVAYSVRYTPVIMARLSKRFAYGISYISGGHTVIPGNGLFLTSKNTNYTAGYTYTGLRRWSFDLTVGRDQSDSIGNVIGRYNDTSGTLSASRQLVKSLHAVAYFSARQYSSQDFNKYNRLIYEGRIGLGWTPGDVPLRVW